MHNCSDDVLAHHDEEVTLPQAKRTNMRDRRDANRNRLKTGLKKNEKPAPCEFVKQGSYAMKTMVQHPNNDYDIDDGVYFNKEELVGDRGAEMSGLQVRQMVRDALDDGSFKKAPEVRSNCVRAYYAAGYHVDLPAYRRVTVTDFRGNETYHHELASSEWKRSDARDVTDWFDRENTGQSPDHDERTPASPARPADQEIRAQPPELVRADFWRFRHHGSGGGMLSCQPQPGGHRTLRHHVGYPEPVEVEPYRQAPGDTK